MAQIGDINQGLLQSGKAGASLFEQALPGIFAQQQRALESGQGGTIGSRLSRKLFPGLFAPSKREQALLDKEQASQDALIKGKAKAIQGGLELAGLGDAASFPAVRDAIQLAATGDEVGAAKINQIMAQSPVAQAQRKTAAKIAGDANRRQNEAADRERIEFEQTGGLGFQEHTNRQDQFNSLQTSRQNLADMMVLLDEFGGESFPTEAQGAYESLQEFTVLQLKEFAKAGALGDEEREFFFNMIPDADTFAKLSPAKRLQKLQEAQRQLGLQQSGIASNTKGLEFNPEVKGRTKEAIFFDQLPNDDPDTEAGSGVSIFGQEGPAGIIPGTGFGALAQIDTGPAIETIKQGAGIVGGALADALPNLRP